MYNPDERFGAVGMARLVVVNDDCRAPGRITGGRPPTAVVESGLLWNFLVVLGAISCCDRASYLTFANACGTSHAGTT